MWKQIIKARLFGHPIHLMLVHFPTALFTAGFLFDAGGMLLNEEQLFSASLYVIFLGLAGGLAAVVFGLIDYAKLSEKPDQFRLASWHASIQFVVLVIFGIIAGLKFQSYPDLEAPDFLEMGIMGAAVIAMLIGNYLGGELVLKYRVGSIEGEEKSSKTG